MIEMNLEEFGVTMLVLVILLITLAYAFTQLSDKLRRRKWDRETHKCPICYTSWMKDKELGDFAKCPNCGRENQIGRLKSLG